MENACSAVFLDVAQLFDTIWCEGLVIKLNRDYQHNTLNYWNSIF